MFIFLLFQNRLFSIGRLERETSGKNHSRQNHSAKKASSFGSGRNLAFPAEKKLPISVH